jgi:signal transduction histidine kinase/ActR/RegA family two-component response regulator
MPGRPRTAGRGTSLAVSQSESAMKNEASSSELRSEADPRGARVSVAEERARLERALHRERRLRELAERASRMKDDFLATVSHELRTPLNAILGWTQTAQSGEASPDTLLRAITQIEQSARAQAKLVEDLLHISDIVAGKMRLEVQPMRLVEHVSAVVEALLPAIQAKQLALEMRMDASADIIRGDPVRIQQVLWNLLANAIKFTPREGRIEVILARERDHAVLEIRDSGEGISSDFLPHVFDRFSQADASSRKRHGGLGLGLSIAQYVVEAHGGAIEARSDGPGRGSVFVVRLPLRTVEIEPAPPQRKHEAGRRTDRASSSLAGIRVLTVDDDATTREMLEEALSRAGAEVTTADSATDALSKLGSFRPHVLVSDIGMPNQDGYDLMRKIRTLPRDAGGATPAVALTGFAREEDRVASWRAGYQAMTPKPVNIAELVSTIRALAMRTLSAAS